MKVSVEDLMKGFYNWVPVFWATVFVVALVLAYLILSDLQVTCWAN